MAEQEKKVMDVAKPEDAKTDIGGKPMIIGHKSMASDPMVRDQESTEKESVVQPDKAEVQVQPPSMSQKTINPPAESVATNKAENKPETTDAKISEVEEPKKEAESEKKEIDATAEAMEREDNVRKIIESKEYRVNIKQARGVNKKLLWTLLSILILITGAMFYFVDTGKLDLGFDLPFSIFDEKQQTKEVENTKKDDQAKNIDNTALEEKKIDPAKTVEVASYNNDTFGISFDYPASWGSVAVEQIKGYADQSYENELPYFLDVTFAGQKDVSLRIINGRAFEGGRGFEGALAEPMYFDSFIHPYSFAFSKSSGGAYEITRVSNSDVSKDLDLAISETDFDLVDTGEAKDMITISPKWTLESLGLLPWDSTANTETQAEAEASLSSLLKTQYFVRNYKTDDVIGINAEYSWKNAKDEFVATQLVEIIASIK